jgi:plasmid maintenance system antidote protein VapI
MAQVRYILIHLLPRYMPDVNAIKDTATALQNDWGLQLNDVVSEEEIIAKLADKIVQVLERGPETFFQLMYRLDISEKKLNAILQDENVPLKIARLVYDRQLQKVESRLTNKTKIQDDDPELKW